MLRYVNCGMIALWTSLPERSSNSTAGPTERSSGSRNAPRTNSWPRASTATRFSRRWTPCAPTRAVSSRTRPWLTSPASASASRRRMSLPTKNCAAPHSPTRSGDAKTLTITPSPKWTTPCACRSAWRARSCPMRTSATACPSAAFWQRITQSSLRGRS